MTSVLYQGERLSQRQHRRKMWRDTEKTASPRPAKRPGADASLAEHRKERAPLTPSPGITGLQDSEAWGVCHSSRPQGDPKETDIWVMFVFNVLCVNWINQDPWFMTYCHYCAVNVQLKLSYLLIFNNVIDISEPMPQTKTRMRK